MNFVWIFPDLQVITAVPFFRAQSLPSAITVTTEGGHSFGSFGNRNAIHYAAKMIDTFYTLKVPDIGKTTYNVGTIDDVVEKAAKL